MGTFQGTQKTHGDANAFCHLHQRQSAPQAHLAQVYTNGAAAIRRWAHQSLALEQLRNSRRIQPAYLSQESRALEQLYILGCIKAVLADAAVRPGEAQAFP